MASRLVIALVLFISFTAAASSSNRLGFDFKEFEGNFGAGDFRAGLLITGINREAHPFAAKNGVDMRIGDLIVAIEADGVEDGEVFEAKELKDRLSMVPHYQAMTLVIQPKDDSKTYAVYRVHRSTDAKYFRDKKAAELADPANAEKIKERVRYYGCKVDPPHIRIQPFTRGYDLQNCQELIKTALKYFSAEQIRGFGETCKPGHQTARCYYERDEYEFRKPICTIMEAKTAVMPWMERCLEQYHPYSAEYQNQWKCFMTRHDAFSWLEESGCR